MPTQDTECRAGCLHPKRKQCAQMRQETQSITCRCDCHDAHDFKPSVATEATLVDRLRDYASRKPLVGANLCSEAANKIEELDAALGLAVQRNLKAVRDLQEAGAKINTLTAHLEAVEGKLS